MEKENDKKGFKIINGNKKNKSQNLNKKKKEDNFLILVGLTCFFFKVRERKGGGRIKIQL